MASVTFMILRPAESENAEVCKNQYIRKGKIFNLCRNKLKRPHNPSKKGILRKNRNRDKNNFIERRKQKAEALNVLISQVGKLAYQSIPQYQSGGAGT